MKYLLLILLFSCTDPDTIVYDPLYQTGDTLFFKKQVVIRHDTLVIIITRDSVKAEPKPKDATFWVTDGGWTMRPDVLFRDGKTRDTIRTHEYIYY